MKTNTAKCDKKLAKLIEELKSVCKERHAIIAGDTMQATLSDPCADEYAEDLAASSALVAAADSLDAAQQRSMTARGAYESCLMENGPGTA